jgi:endonuclease/exonuclease/phosphatase (EEP) superfamily protein YafD
MHVLSSPIHYIKSRRVYKKQKRTALHMLAVSGVVRPGHVELRYAAPIASITAFRAQPTAIKHPQTQAIPPQPENCNITFNIKQTRQWTRNLTSAIIQLANKPVTLPWTKQLDM